MSVSPLFPIAISSQLDDSGVERIHAADIKSLVRPSYCGIHLSGALADGFVGGVVDYQYTVSASGSFSLSVISGAIPAGIDIDTSGHVTGVFTTPGTFTFTLRGVTPCGASTTLEDTVEVTTEVLPPQLSDWRYFQTGSEDNTDYSAPEFDDSVWPIGAAPFGGWESGYGPADIAVGAPTGLTFAPEYDSRFAETFATNWTPNTRLWLRRTLTLSTVPAGGIQVTSFMDDHYLLYVNGILLVTSAAGSPTGGGAVFSIPEGSLVEGDNVIAIRCDDEDPIPGVSAVYADFIIENT